MKECSITVNYLDVEKSTELFENLKVEVSRGARFVRVELCLHFCTQRSSCIIMGAGKI